MNQITISMFMAESRGKPQYNENLIRHMVFSSILNIRKKFGSFYGEIVLCYDSPNSWRSEVFPNYKHTRKKKRQESDFDWGALMNLLESIKEDLLHHFPYKVLQIARCEADDIIAVLCKNISEKEPVLIISSDKDFQQLQSLNSDIFCGSRGVEQWSPLHKEKLVCNKPDEFLFDQIIHGDSSDGVPNILSPDDIFTKEGTRQKSITAKKYKEWLDIFDNNTTKDCTGITDDIEIVKNIVRNATLIDFQEIPADIQKSVLDKYECTVVAKKDGMINYFIDKRMTNLIDHITEF